MKNNNTSKPGEHQLIKPAEISLILFAVLFLVAAYPGKATRLNNTTAIVAQQAEPDLAPELLQTAEQDNQTYTLVAETSTTLDAIALKPRQKLKAPPAPSEIN